MNMESTSSDAYVEIEPYDEIVEDSNYSTPITRLSCSTGAVIDAL